MSVFGHERIYGKTVCVCRRTYAYLDGWHALIIVPWKYKAQYSCSWTRDTCPFFSRNYRLRRSRDLRLQLAFEPPKGRCCGPISHSALYFSSVRMSRCSKWAADVWNISSPHITDVKLLVLMPCYSGTDVNIQLFVAMAFSTSLL